MATKELVKTKNTFNLLNVAPATFVSDTLLKSTDKDIKEAKALYNVIMTTIASIEFMKEKDIINPSYFGQDGGRWNSDSYIAENIIGKRVFGKLTPELTRNIINYNTKIQNLADRHITLPKDIVNISYTEQIFNKDNREREFVYIRPSVNPYSEILNSRIFSNTSDLTKLADIFGFVIMPLSIAKDTIYSCDPFRDSTTIKNAVKEYTKFNNKKEMYVLCPLDFYDLMSHAKAEKYHQVYFPKSLPHLGMNIGMSLPVFRTIFESVGMLDQRVTQLEKNVESIKKQLVSIETNIKVLQNEVNKLAQSQINLRMEMIAQDKKFTAYKLEMQQQMARMIDPLLFSVDKSIEDFDVSVPCQLGFAWGAEFPEAFINMLGVNTTNNTKNIWLK